MKQVFRPLLVMHPDAAFRDRVRQACGTDYHFQTLPDWDSLHTAIREAPPAALAMVDPYGEMNGLSGSLRSLLSEFPSTAILAAPPETLLEPARDLTQRDRWTATTTVRRPFVARAGVVSCATSGLRREPRPRRRPATSGAGAGPRGRRAVAPPARHGGLPRPAG